MDVRPRTCDRQALELLLADRLDDGERTALEDHLGGCPLCQTYLDRAAAEGNWWAEARGYLAAADLAPGSGPRDAAVADRAAAALAALRTYLAPTDDPRLLGRLKGYEVVGVIGLGGMGVVLKGFDAPLNRYVAIKVLGPQLAPSAAARQRFAREARAAAAVVHDNVVAIHAVAEANGLPFFVMPYLRGPSLEKRLRETGAFPVVEVLRIGMQVASGLAAAHAQGLVHRDIKPANILLGEGVERVTLTDFGLARAVDDASLTQQGAIAGTPLYMSPEQARGGPIDHRSDLFSLGSVLYALCTGWPPFRDGTTLGVLRRVETEEPRPVREVNPDVPDWLAAIVEGLQAKDPADRFQTAAEVAALLEGCLAHLHQQAANPDPVRPSPRPSNLQAAVAAGAAGERVSARGFSRRRWLAALALAVLLVGEIAWWLLGGLGQPDGAGGGADQRDEATHLVFDFRKGIENLPPCTLHGPQADSVAKPDAQGLRIRLPAGRQDTDVVGVDVPVRLQGDFDVALGYELLAVGDPVPTYGGGVAMRLLFGEPSSLTAVMSRSRKPAGDQFGTYKVVKDADGKEKYLEGLEFQTTEPRGRMRLVRTGSLLQFLVSEAGAEPRELRSLEIGTEDVRLVRIYATTTSKPILLDVYLTDLDIRAARIARPNQPSDPVPPASPGAAAPAPGAAKGWLAAALGGLLVTLAAVGVWLYGSRRRRAEASRAQVPVEDGPARPEAVARSVSFSCAGCGKKLKVKAELAGKKVKCPQCGQAALVPGTRADEAGRTPP